MDCEAISDNVAEMAPNALIRGGDFPGEKHFNDLTLIPRSYPTCRASLRCKQPRSMPRSQGQLLDTR
jgi:hypothetical protein